INVAFTDYSTGHILSKSEAIAGIKTNSMAEAENGKSYTIAPARDDSGHFLFVMKDDSTGKTYIGTKEGLKPVPRADLTISDGEIVAARGYHVLKGTELGSIDPELSTFTVPVGGDKAIQAQGFDTAVVLQPTLRYDPHRDEFVRIKDSVVFRPNGLGSYVSASGEELEPGWKAYVGTRNFGRIVHSSLIRSPFLMVMVWTFVFATLVVFVSFAIGLLLAIALNLPGLPFQRTYRSP